MSLSLNAMSMRLKLILVAVITIVVAAGWFLVSYRPTSKHLAEVRMQVAQKRQEVAQLQAQVQHLQALKANEPKLRALIAHYGAALPADPGLPQFILQIQDAANKAGIDFLSVSPSLPAAAGGTSGTTNVATGLREINVSINTTGRYFTLENFMYRLEHLDRALRVDTFSLGNGGGGAGSDAAAAGSGSLTMSLKFRMFMSPTPAAPSTATTPTTPTAGA